MERGRGKRPGDHLTDLAKALLDPDEAVALDTRDRQWAAVLVPIFGWRRDETDPTPAEGAGPGLILTERRPDLRRHAGEISFPGGRADPGESLVECALREANEEIGLDPSSVEVVGALPPTSTVVTPYRILPVVGLVPGGLEHRLSPAEVERVIEPRLEELRRAYRMRRLLRRGVPFRSPTFDLPDAFVWGATARILQDLFHRLDRA